MRLPAGAPAGGDRVLGAETGRAAVIVEDDISYILQSHYLPMTFWLRYYHYDHHPTHTHQLTLTLRVGWAIIRVIVNETKRRPF